MKKKAKKDKKSQELDDYTVANMNVEGFKWYKSPHEKKRKGDFTELNLTRKEKRAMIKAAFINWMPTLISILIGFTIAALLCYWWLS